MARVYGCYLARTAPATLADFVVPGTTMSEADYDASGPKLRAVAIWPAVLLDVEFPARELFEFLLLPEKHGLLDTEQISGKPQPVPAEVRARK